MSLQISRLRAEDLDELVEMFALVEQRFFPHATRDAATNFVEHAGHDIYLVGRAAGRIVAFGMLRGWDLGYEVPSLGIAVSADVGGRGHGRQMMLELHRAARGADADLVRLRVHPDNATARRLYESLGYVYSGEERGELVMVFDLASAR